MSGNSQPWILGISSSHNGAVCLLKGDTIVAAIQEERLTRKKRKRIHASQSMLSIEYCLGYAGIQASDLSMVVNCTQGILASPLEDVSLNPQLQVERNKIPVLTLSHHEAHAVSACALSGFRDSAVLVIDGIGSPAEDLSEAERRVVKQEVENGWEIISLYDFVEGSVVPLEKHLVENGSWLETVFSRMPKFQSLGAMFSSAAWQIFGSDMEAGKVMGLAPYGKPTIPAQDFLEIEDGAFLFKDTVPGRFLHNEHWPERREEYQDLAASTQEALEEALRYLAGRMRELSGSKNFCYAGGVALNSVANEKVIRYSEFDDFYIISSAEDSGPAIGAAYHGLWQLRGFRQNKAMNHDSCGRVYTDQELEAAIASTPSVEVVECDDTIEKAVDLLCEGKILGWFQGGSEFGPRALGFRSVLCDPRNPKGKEILNKKVKHREAFRPFAPAILLEEVDEWFDLDGAKRESPFMLRVCPFKEEKKGLVPAVVHVDGTGRVQTVTAADAPRYHDLIARFHARTGVPIILNTSYNVMGEPIVESPEDALWALIYTGLDYCVLGDKLIGKKGLASILDLYPRIVSRSYSMNFLIPLGESLTAAAEHETFVTFRVETPWGNIKQVASTNVLPVLSLIDGQTNGWDILKALPKEPLPKVDESLLGNALRHWRGISNYTNLLDEMLTPIEVVETLYHERVEAYDETSLVKILGRLRRAGVVDFKAKPFESLAGKMQKVRERLRSKKKALQAAQG